MGNKKIAFLLIGITILLLSWNSIIYFTTASTKLNDIITVEDLELYFDHDWKVHSETDTTMILIEKDNKDTKFVINKGRKQFPLLSFSFFSMKNILLSFDSNYPNYYNKEKATPEGTYYFSNPYYFCSRGKTDSCQEWIIHMRKNSTIIEIKYTSPEKELSFKQIQAFIDNL